MADRPFPTYDDAYGRGVRLDPDARGATRVRMQDPQQCAVELAIELPPDELEALGQACLDRAEAARAEQKRISSRGGTSLQELCSKAQTIAGSLQGLARGEEGPVASEMRRAAEVLMLLSDQASALEDDVDDLYERLTTKIKNAWWNCSGSAAEHDAFIRDLMYLAEKHGKSFEHPNPACRQAKAIRDGKPWERVG